MRTFFIVGVRCDDRLPATAASREGRAVLVGTRLPAALKSNLYCEIRGDQSALKEAFFEGDFLAVLQRKYLMDSPVGPARAAEGIKRYEQAVQWLKDAHEAVRRAESQLAIASKELVEVRGTAPMIFGGERHHVSYHHKTGRIFWAPSRGGRKRDE